MLKVVYVAPAEQGKQRVIANSKSHLIIFVTQDREFIMPHCNVCILVLLLGSGKDLVPV